MAQYFEGLFVKGKELFGVENYINLADVPADVRKLDLFAGKIKSLDGLRQLKKLRQLSISTIKQEAIPLLAELTQLEVLEVGYCRTSVNDLAPLGSLKKLKCLILQSLTQVSSVAFLRGLPQLKSLCILDCRQVTDLAPLAALTQLEELFIDSGGMLGKQVEVKTLDPLEKLKKLKYLDLFVMAGDKSLRAIGRLKALKKLGINGLHPWQEYAKLAGCFKNPPADSLKKAIHETGYPRCRKNKSHQMVYLWGKGKKAVCRDCSPEKVEQLQAEYDEQYAIGKSGKW